MFTALFCHYHSKPSSIQNTYLYFYPASSHHPWSIPNPATKVNLFKLSQIDHSSLKTFPEHPFPPTLKTKLLTVTSRTSTDSDNTAYSSPQAPAALATPASAAAFTPARQALDSGTLHWLSPLPAMLSRQSNLLTPSPPFMSLLKYLFSIKPLLFQNSNSCPSAYFLSPNTLFCFP